MKNGCGRNDGRYLQRRTLCANERVRSMVAFSAAVLQERCLRIGLCRHFTSGANSNEEKAAHFDDFPFPKSLANVTAVVDIFSKWTTDFGKGERHVCNGCITRYSSSTVVRTFSRRFHSWTNDRNIARLNERMSFRMFVFKVVKVCCRRFGQR